jgi:hypothetical protein
MRADLDEADRLLEEPSTDNDGDAAETLHRRTSVMAHPLTTACTRPPDQYELTPVLPLLGAAGKPVLPCQPRG